MPLISMGCFLDKILSIFPSGEKYICDFSGKEILPICSVVVILASLSFPFSLKKVLCLEEI